MKYLLDTDVVINHLRGRKPLKEKYIKEGTAISIISYGELLYGACKSQNKDRSLSLIAAFLDELSITILNLNRETMQEYAKMKSKLESIGKGLDEFDLLIGSTA
jgi:tRNA(fMet)-specific endonuclease VapC